METLKAYLNKNLRGLTDYLDTWFKDHQYQSVYNENSRPKNKTRIWLSFDKSDGNYDELYAWFKTVNVESWGNSVATFLVDKPLTTNQEVKNYLVNELINANVLNANKSGEEDWKNTKNISIYVFYRWHKLDWQKEDLNSNHFVLIQNAPVSKLGNDDMVDINR